MPNLIKNNAYHILGLGISATQKEISKRSKEIINYLKIHDVPIYDLDINFFDDFRTESAVKKAVQKLQKPKDKIKDFFFWFNISDNTDKQALAEIQTKKYEKALKTWKNELKNNKKSLFYKKNIALLLCLLLSEKTNKEQIKYSISLWGELLNSEEFWKAFSQTYKRCDEHLASKEILETFKKNIIEYISDIYTELHELHNEPLYISEFKTLFKLKGKKAERSILEPIYQTLNQTSEDLEKMKISEDGVFDMDEKRKVKELVNTLQLQFNKLIDLGLYNDTHTKIIRDRAADAIKTVVLDLHNNLDETEKALSLLKIALDFAGTSGMTTKLKHEIKSLKIIQKNSQLVSPIIDLITDEKFEEALLLIKTQSDENENNPDLETFYKTHKKVCISSLAVKQYKQAREYFDNDQESSAKPLFHEIANNIYQNIDLFNFNKEAIDEIIADINSKVSSTNMHNINQLQEYRNAFVDVAKNKFEGEFEETILMILIDTYLYGGLCDFMQKMRHKVSVVNTLNILGWITVWFYGIGLIFFIAAYVYKNDDV
jgi:hypothetical protein